MYALVPKNIIPSNLKEFCIKNTLFLFYSAHSTAEKYTEPATQQEKPELTTGENKKGAKRRV
jgi:hypothetical protein